MTNTLEEIKKMIIEIAQSPQDILSDDDALISEIISIERKHLHRLEGTSEKKRRDDIEKKIREHLPKEILKK